MRRNIRRFLFAALTIAAVAVPSVVRAQSTPGLTFGQVPTAGQWNSYFAAKQDVLGYTPLNKAGDTMTGKLVTVASTTTRAGFNLPHGTAPTSPVNGDLWTTTSGMYVRVNGATVGPLVSGGTLSLAQGNIFIGNSSGLATAKTPVQIGTYYATAYGAICNGSTDDTTAIQSAITVAGSNRVVLPASDCVINTAGTGLVINGATWLVGTGTGGGRGFTNHPLAGTRLLCGGTGTMITMEPTAAGPKIIGGGIVDIALDGNNTCATGLSAKSVENADFKIDLSNFTTVGMLTGVIPAIADGDNRYFARNRLWITFNQGTSNGVALKMTGDSGASSIYNNIPMLSGTYSNGIALEITGGDSNEFGLVALNQQPGGTALYGVALRAGATPLQTASYNHFRRIVTGSTTAGMLVEGTDLPAAVAANFNVIDVYDTVDAEPLPSFGAGVSGTYCLNINLDCFFGGKVSAPAATGFYLSSTQTLYRSGNYTQLSQADGGSAAILSLGNNSDRTFYFDVNSVRYATINSSGLRLGITGTTGGQLIISGSSTGGATFVAPAAAGTPTITTPTGSGTIAVAATSPLALSAAGVLTCSGCVTSAASLTANSLMIGSGSQASSVTTTGTGVLTALGTSVGSSGAFVTNGGVLGTPSSGVGTNITNVNAATLGGATFSAPGAIGGGTPSTGAFTTLTPTNIVGTTTNNDASAGSVGQYPSSTIPTGSAVSLTSGAAANVTSISLTAGDWDVSGVISYNFGATTQATSILCSLSTTSANVDLSAGSYGQIAGITIITGGSLSPTIECPTLRQSLSGTTTIYLVAYSTFSVSTLAAWGQIRARRVR